MATGNSYNNNILYSKNDNTYNYPSVVVHDGGGGGGEETRLTHTITGFHKTCPCRSRSSAFVESSSDVCVYYYNNVYTVIYYAIVIALRAVVYDKNV